MLPAAPESGDPPDDAICSVPKVQVPESEPAFCIVSATPEAFADAHGKSRGAAAERGITAGPQPAEDSSSEPRRGAIGEAKEAAEGRRPEGAPAQPDSRQTNGNGGDSMPEPQATPLPVVTFDDVELDEELRPWRLQSLEECMQNLAEAEDRWGAEHGCVAESLRRMLHVLEREGRPASQTLPLWLRVLHIERHELGEEHAGVLDVEGKCAMELQRLAAERGEDAVEAYLELVLRPPSWPVRKVELPKEQRPSFDDAEPLPSHGRISSAEVAGAVVASVGGAALGAAIYMSSSAVTVAGSTAANAAEAAASAAATYAAPADSWAWSAAGVASRTAWGATRTAASSTSQATTNVAVSLANDAARPALHYAGSSLANGASWAASGAFSFARRSFSGAADSEKDDFSPKRHSV